MQKMTATLQGMKIQKKASCIENNVFDLFEMMTVNAQLFPLFQTPAVMVFHTSKFLPFGAAAPKLK